jgi:hypothetical protein
MGRDQLSERMADHGLPGPGTESSGEATTNRLWNEAQNLAYRAERVYDLLTRMETSQVINDLGWQKVRGQLLGLMRGGVSVPDVEKVLGVKAHPIGIGEALRKLTEKEPDLQVQDNPGLIMVNNKLVEVASTAREDAEELVFWLTIDHLDEGWVEFRNPTDKSAQLVGMNRTTWNALGSPSRIQAVITDQLKVDES